MDIIKSEEGCAEILIDIKNIQAYYKRGMVFMSEHASTRSRQRNISQKDIKNCIFSGEIIEQYENDYPWPSCLIFGYTVDKRIIHVVASDNGEMSKIITAYIPDKETFMDDLKTRRER